MTDSEPEPVPEPPEGPALLAAICRCPRILPLPGRRWSVTVAVTATVTVTAPATDSATVAVAP